MNTLTKEKPVVNKVNIDSGLCIDCLERITCIWKHNLKMYCENH